MGMDIKATVKDNINFASAMCDERQVDNVVIEGLAGKKIILRVFGMPEFIYEFKSEVTPTIDTYKMGSLDLNLNQAFWRNDVIEALDATLNFEVLDGEDQQKVLCSTQQKVHLQPYQQWDNHKHATLACFVQPNDPAVIKVLTRAGEIANEKGLTMCGYQSDTVMEQVECIYQALAELKLHYFNPPAGFMDAGQKIRIPSMVLDEQCKQGTCLDLAILMASCLEAAAIHPVLFVIKGHAFAGFWKEAARLNADECTDLSFVKDNLAVEIQGGALLDIGDGLIVPVECTVMTDDQKISFASAVGAGINNLDNSTFQYMLDIEKCREFGYVPTYTIGGKPINPAMVKSVRKLTKLQRMQRQAMDFSMRNQLLSRKKSEDSVRFTFSANDFFQQEYTGTELCLNVRENAKTFGLNLEKVDKRLFTLLREDIKARRDFGEGVVYLTVNAIEWCPGEGKTAEAPVYLVPAEIYRNLRGELLFDCDFAKSVVNPVIRELLHSDYGIDISLLMDCPGKEYKDQMTLLTQILEANAGWRVVENLFEVGIYQMPNQAIYEGLCDESLAEHEIVRGILDGKMSWKNDCALTAEEVAAGEDNSQEESKAEHQLKVLYPFASDGSQRKVIQSIDERRAEVVFGPAGNGKSQTIANIIVDQISQGKKVLFIAEKTPAQEVIYDKLKEIKLDPFCMYFPEGKNTMDGVRSQTENTLKVITSYKEQKVDQKAIDDYNREVRELLAYHEAMREKDEAGDNLLDLFQEAQKYSKVKGRMDLSGLSKDADIDRAPQILRNLANCVKNGIPEGAYDAWKLKGLDGSEAERKPISDAVYTAIKDKTECGNALTNLQLVYNMAFFELTDDQIRERLEKYTELFKKCPAVGNTLPGAEDADLKELLALAHDVATLSIGSERFEKSRDALIPKMMEFDAKKESKSHLFYIEDASSLYRMKPNRPMGMPLTADEKKLIQLHSAYKQYEKTLLDFAAGKPEDEGVQAIRIARMIARGEGDAVKKAMEAYEEAKAKAEASANRAEELALVTGYPMAERYDLFHTWLALEGKWREVQPFVLVREKAADAHLEVLVDRALRMLEKGEVSIEELADIFAKSLTEIRVDKVLNRLPLFDGSRSADYQFYLNGLAEREGQAREALRCKIKNELMATMPNLAEGVQDDEQIGILQKMIRHSENGATVRELFGKAGSALLQLFPCMIMGPYTAAECLSKDMPEFDLVIFDEGSQLPTFKALIPISKAKKCMIVGDEKQLTPTSFFQKNLEDEEGQGMKKEAILEDAIITSMPQVMLKYHYRSKYESLVAFSNSRYYHGEIVTFPGTDASLKGVECIYVEDGLYDRGGHRNNQKEAQKVLELIKDIYAKLPEDTTETVGVITFNMEQKELIEELIRQDVCGDSRGSKKIMELVEVVNLEACQGKEWDTTILSTAYGKDKDGKFTGNMGPMSREEGKNRLNVMATRAKKYMYVVTSILPGMIDPAAGAGLGDVRDFILYTNGELKLDSRNTETCEEQDNSLAGEITARLQEIGYTVHRNIGSSDCKVSLGVLDESGEQYQLGILLEDYDCNFDIVDHELMIPGALKRCGWQIYRLFAANWYKHPDQEIKQIVKLLK